MKQFFQCRLQRGNKTTTAWIEARGAKPGVQVELLPSHEKWRVAEVFKTHPLPEETLRNHQAMNRRSLPSVEGTA